MSVVRLLELDEPVPLAQLIEFISKLVERKRTLQSENVILKQGKKELQKAFSELFEQKNVTQFDLDRYRKTERELKEYGLSLKGPEMEKD